MNSTLEITTIGSAVVDIFIQSDEFMIKRGRENETYLCQLYGDKLEVSDFQVHTGGGGSNTAAGFARLGYSVGVVTETGKDSWTQLVLNNLSRHNVKTDFVVKEKKEQTGGSIILIGQDGGRTILVHRGASSMLDPHDIPQERLVASDWIHLASIAGQGKTLQTIFETIRNQGRNNLSWNPGKGELKLLAEGVVEVSTLPCRVLLVNRREWESLAPVQDQLRSHVEQIVVTAGGEGGQVFQKNGSDLHFSSQSTEVVDETGAGDSFAVGYVTGLLSDKSPEEAARWGVANATSVISQVGAKPGLLDRHKLQEVLSNTTR